MILRMLRQTTAALEPVRGASEDGHGRPGNLVESYRRLAEVFHLVLSEQSLDALLDRIAETLADLMPYEALHIYQVDEDRRELIPVLARSQAYEDEIMKSRPRFGEGITGWAVEHRRPVWTNQAHLDPRVVTVPGTPVEPEALISVPLIARGALKGALNIYRIGEQAGFADHEFELAKWFGDAAALAVDNAQIRARLEHLAQTDSLTGLYNHRFFHERLRAELTRASRAHDSIAVLMFDLDDFKRVNDVYGHGAGDQLLIQVARLARDTVRESDVVCRIGGEEFGVIMPSCDAGDALGLAARLTGRIGAVDFEPAGSMTVSIGISQGPDHAMNPRELVACAESAMMAAKARGKNQTVLYDERVTERPAPGAAAVARDVRSIAHLKMLQSLAGKLNRLNDVQQIGQTIATELRLLIDYHNCRVVLRDGDELRPITFVGDYGSSVQSAAAAYTQKVGVGITGRVAETGESLLVPNALECEFALKIPGTQEIEESLALVPLRYGSRVTGVIVISKLGLNQFDDDDVRLLEVLAGQASVALENARLYEGQRREAADAKALLAFADVVSVSRTVQEICEHAVQTAVSLFGTDGASLWLDGACVATVGPALSEGTSWPLVEGDGIRGRLVLFAGDGMDDRQLRLLAGLAHQTKLAIESVEHFESLEEAFVSTVASLANALEASDPYASAHSRWVADMTRLVGRELQLEPEALARLEWTALFHDIGKIGIPSGILQKPGPLTEEELEIVRQHPELGEKILEPIDRLADVRSIVRACHERWDGLGYPDGKAGEEIPLEARVVLVCDAFHAMVTDRPYRRRLALGEAARRLRAGAGTQFDPRVVEAFDRLFEAGEVAPL